MGLDFMDPADAADYEEALILAEYGKFHYSLLAICGFIYLNTAVGITIVSFVLPAATCDFKMSSEDKGWLSASPMLGMLIGSYFWGCLADTRGRRIVLIATLLLDGIFGLISSVSQYYILFLLCRFFNGIGVAGAMGICFPYLGEFQPTKYREKVLCWLELFWTFGVIALPAIAWLIIPLEINIVKKGFLFHSWNLFVAICALPSIALGLWLCFFPESPKFLLERGEAERALDILRQIYSKNTGNDPADYPIVALIGKPALDMSRKSVKILERRRVSEPTESEIRARKPKKLKMFLMDVIRQTKMLWLKPHLRNTTITCAVQFGLTSSYYTLMVWFPEIFNRYQAFEAHIGGSASLCEITSKLQSKLGEVGTSCQSNVRFEVYFHTLIIGLSCIPTSLILPLCIHRLGAKFFLVFCLLASGGVVFGLYFVKTATQNLILSCIFEALTSLSISLVYTVMVDLFPTNLRVMAAALAATFGRAGAFLGNSVFGFLIDFDCVIPIVLFASLLIISGLLCFLLPSTGQTALE